MMRPNPIPAEIDHARDVTNLFQIEGAYAHLFDTGQAEEWAALFAPDGVFRLDPLGGRPGVVLTGRQELAERCAAFRDAEVGLHFVHPPRLEIAQDGASAWVPFSFFGIDRTTGDTRQSEGFYRVSYRRAGQGWVIADRHEHPIQRGRSRTG